jgi:hypothetical protein
MKPSAETVGAAVLLALFSAGGSRADEGSGPVRIAVGGGDVAVAWADGDYGEQSASLAGTGPAEVVLINRSEAPRPISDLAVSSDPARIEMVTLTATSGPRTHMTSVRNPTGEDVLSFDPGLVLGGGESIDVAVETTPRGD